MWSFYGVRIVDETLDGVLEIDRIEKLSGFAAIIYVCYLPPDNSIWGYDPTIDLAHLLSELCISMPKQNCFYFVEIFMEDQQETFLIQQTIEILKYHHDMWLTMSNVAMLMLY